MLGGVGRVWAGWAGVLGGVGIALEMKGASFAWDMELKAEDLHTVNFRADAGGLGGLGGSVGRGVGREGVTFV